MKIFLQYTLLLITSTFLSELHATSTIEYWTFTYGEVSSQVNPASSLVHQVPTRACCNGIYSTVISKNDIRKKTGNTDLRVLYLPGVGGVTDITIDKSKVAIEGMDHTSDGLIVPLPNLDELPDKFKVDVQVEGSPSYFVGFSRVGKWPEIGSFDQLAKKREQNTYYQQTVPLFTAILLLIFSSAFIIIYYSLNKRTSLYRNFAVALATWSLFYLFLSGEARSLHFEIGSLLHFPARTIAAYGLLLLVARASSISEKGVQNYGYIFLAVIIVETILGIFGLPIHQSALFALSSILSFAPLISFRPKRDDPIGFVIGVLGAITVMGQVVDALKIHQGLLGIQMQAPFVNRITFPPLLLVSFGDCIIQFTKSFHQLRLHLFRAKSSARAILHAAKEGLSHNNVGYYLKVTGKICGYSRVSLAQRNEDGVYKIVKLVGSTFAAEGVPVDLSKGEAMANVVKTGRIAFDSVRKVSAGWNTADYAAVPVPETPNPPYLMLLSDPKSSSEKSLDVLLYLSQISSAIWTNLERTREQELRAQSERKFGQLVQKLDPSLYDFVMKNLDKIVDPSSPIAEIRGIIFFDQKGYSSIVEDFDNHTMARFAEIVGSWVTQSVARYGARVSSFAGDAFLLETFALASESVGELAKRTVSLVWDLGATMSELNQLLLKAGFTPILFRFGAHIGSVATANLDFINQGLHNSIGDTVNVAARLQSLAKGGCIYLSGDLEQYIREHFITRLVPKKYVKGRQKPIEIYELVGKVVEENSDDGEAA